jgi:predicted metalloprotease with PDZ domain
MPTFGKTLCIPALLLLAGVQSRAQIKTDLLNWQGASAPCIGIGPVGGPLAKKCADLFEQAGFIRQSDLGSSGLTLGSASDDSSTVSAVAPGSAAEALGIAPGDVILAVNDVHIVAHPATEARRLLFGEYGASVHIQLERAGAAREATMQLARIPVQQPPKLKGGFMTVIKPLINWRGDYIPCMGAGPAYMVALEYCDKHFKPYGFIKPDAAAGAGLAFDEDNTQAAVVKSVDSNSAAAQAGLMPGDRVMFIDGKPVPGGAGDQARQLLFGKTGTKFKIDVSHQGQVKTVELTLAAAH